MKKYLKNIPEKRIVEKEGRILYSLGSVQDCYKHFEYNKGGLLFKVYYKPSGYWQAYYLKPSKTANVFTEDNYALVLNTKSKSKPSYISIIYQDKAVRLLMYYYKNKKRKDFVFVLKGKSENVKKRE